MSGYTKLFHSILMSSVWEEPCDTRITWVALLALADQHGHVDGTARSLARVARVSVEACEAALLTFLSPDPHDRSGVAEGRRIEAAPGGWRLINHATYRHRMGADERRERDKVRKREERATANPDESLAKNEMSARRPLLSEFVRDVQQAEAEAEAEQKQTRARKDVSPATRAEPPADTVLTFIAIGKPAVWHLTQAQVTDWEGVYPGLDVLGECRKASAWLLANGRKTASGMPRFLVSWLNRTTNSAPARTGPSPYGSKTSGNVAALQEFVRRHQEGA
jgi:hypothetical protein